MAILPENMRKSINYLNLKTTLEQGALMFQHSLRTAKATLPCLIILSSMQLHGAAFDELVPRQIPSLLELCAKKIVHHNIPYKHTPARFVIYPEMLKFEHERIQRLNSIRHIRATRTEDLDIVDDLLAPTEPWNNPHEIALCRQLKNLIMRTHITADNIVWPLTTFSSCCALGAALVSIAYCPVFLENSITCVPCYAMSILVVPCATDCCWSRMIKKLKLKADPVFDRLSCNSQWRSHLEPPQPMIMEDFETYGPHKKTD